MSQTNKGFGNDLTQVLEDQSTKATPDLALMDEEMDSKTSDLTDLPETTDEYNDSGNESNRIEDNIFINHGKNETSLVPTNERDISINPIFIVIPSVTTGLILIGVLICLLIIKKHKR